MLPISKIDDYLKQRNNRVDVYAETPLNDMLEQFRNPKLKVMKKRLFK